MSTIKFGRGIEKLYTDRGAIIGVEVDEKEVLKALATAYGMYPEELELALDKAYRMSEEKDDGR